MIKKQRLEPKALTAGGLKQKLLKADLAFEWEPAPHEPFVPYTQDPSATIALPDDIRGLNEAFAKKRQLLAITHQGTPGSISRTSVGNKQRFCISSGSNYFYSPLYLLLIQSLM
jgi:hypothetical protein